MPDENPIIMKENNMQKFYVVGIGPGERDQMTIKAFKTLSDVDVIAGYGTYIDLVKPFFPDKEYLQNGMTGEVKRCEMALEKAKEGKTVAMISSGDPGIYGMSGLVLELAKDMDIEVVTIPGITAAASGASLLGAPLMHDFAVISLSDRLTDWNTIRDRIKFAAAADKEAVGDELIGKILRGVPLKDGDVIQPETGDVLFAQLRGGRVLFDGADFAFVSQKPHFHGAGTAAGADFQNFRVGSEL